MKDVRRGAKLAAVPSQVWGRWLALATTLFLLIGAVNNAADGEHVIWVVGPVLAAAGVAMGFYQSAPGRRSGSTARRRGASKS